MPAYFFTMTMTCEREAEVEINADNFQEACRQLAQRSQSGQLQWKSSVDLGGDQTLVRAISKDGERVPGVYDPAGGRAPGWYGLNGTFDTEDMPPEFMAIKD